MPARYDPRTVLQRVLLLERQQGFADRSAVGGLSAFARTQLDRSGPSPDPAMLSAAEALDGYSDFDRRGREAAVSFALRHLLTGRQQAGLTEPVSTLKASDNPSLVHGGRPRSASTALAGPARRGELRVVHSSDELHNPLQSLKGVGKSTSLALSKLNVVTIRDLLYFFPRAHYDYTDTRSISRMRLGQPGTLVGT